ncbi:MAG TPA: DsbA family oxidoreductase, partial [Byssovorax sp.]
GLDFHFERARPGNTFDAHRLIHLAGEHGKQDAMKERLLRAYMTEGAAIGDRGALVELAVEVGLDADEARAALSSERFSDEVRADEREAREIGIRGVPFFVFDGRLAVSGAQPAEVLLGALERAKADRAVREPELVEGAACGPDGCG